MGNWGAGGFENDTAADFVAGITSADDLAAELESLQEGPSDVIDADQAQRIIAAAECVAAMMGRPAGDVPDDLPSKLASFGKSEPQLVEAAREAVSSVLGRSELTDLWAEGDSAAFNLAVTSLIERLNPDLSFIPPDPTDAKDVRQTCGFCNGEIAPEELVAIEIRQHVDPINVLDHGFWCHLACLNARLHPGHIVQNWKLDPEAMERAANRLLDC